MASLWNSLPHDVIVAKSLEEFQKGSDIFMENKSSQSKDLKSNQEFWNVPVLRQSQSLNAWD